MAELSQSRSTVKTCALDDLDFDPAIRFSPGTVPINKNPLPPSVAFVRMASRGKLKMAKTAKKSKYNLVAELHEGILKTIQVTRSGEIKIKRTDLKNVVETTFTAAAKLAAKGQRIRLPVIGAIARKDVAARKGGVKTTNPFTKEPMVTKARPASKKPRWSFPRALKDTFANKKNW